MTRRAHARARSQARPRPSWQVESVDAPPSPVRVRTEEQSLLLHLLLPAGGSLLRGASPDSFLLLCFSSFPLPASPLHQGLRTFPGRARFSLAMRKAHGVSGDALTFEPSQPKKIRPCWCNGPPPWLSGLLRKVGARRWGGPVVCLSCSRGCHLIVMMPGG